MVEGGDRVPGPGRCKRERGRLSCVLLLLALLGALPRAMAADAVGIDAVVGFADTFRPGRWTPLNVTVTNHGGDLAGELEVQVTGGDPLRGRQFIISHRRQLELHRESRKSLQFTVFLHGPSHPLVIRVHAGGRELARTQVDLRERVAAERLLVVLSRDANLDYLNDRAADGLRVLYPHPGLLPAHWRGYDAVAAVLVHGVSLERLTTGQFDALHKWIAQGGILAVSGGPDYALLRSPRLAALLPGQPSGMTRVDAGALQRAFSASLDVSRPVHVNSLGDFRGHARLRAGEAMLIVERPLGLGRVLCLTFDAAAHPFQRWDGMSGLWREHLRLPPDRAVPTAADPGVESPLPALIRAETASFPSHAAVVVFLALYLGLLLAGHRLSSHGTRSRWLAPLASWAVPVLCAAAAWLLFGPAAFPRGATAVTVAVIEPFPESHYARLELDLGAYANRSGALRLEYRGAEPVLYPSHRAQREGNAGDWTLGEGARRYVEPLDRRRYVLHRLEGEDVISFHVEASVRDEAIGPQLLLDNASGRPLEDLWLVFDGHAYELGSVAAGARIERGLIRGTHGVAVGEASWRRVLKPPSGAPVRTPAPSRLVLERRSQDAGESGYPGPGQALLIGYTASPVQPAGASAGWPRRERALVAFRVAAVPGAAPADRIEAGPPGPGDEDPDRPDLPRVSGAGADPAAARQDD